MLINEEVKLDEGTPESIYCISAKETLVIVGYAHVSQDTVYWVGLNGALHELIYVRKDEGPTDLYYTTFLERKSLVKAKTYRKMRIQLDATALNISLVPKHAHNLALRNKYRWQNIYITIFGLRDTDIARLQMGETQVPIPVRYARSPSKRTAFNTK